MAPRTVRVGDLDLCCETIGNPDDPALLLVMGFGVQLTEWDRTFVQAFADAGFHVIRYDHRDTGLSAKLAAPYSLADMADDGIGLVRALGSGRVHVLGASMGGMIAQLMAIRHPDVVLSLCSVMSTTGAPGVGGPQPGVLEAMRAAPTSREEVVEHAVRSHHLVSGGGYPVDEEAARRRAQEAYDRSYCPDGQLRQRQAVRSAPDRTEALGRLQIPVVVLHGADDPLVSVTGGEATAAAIPGAELVVFPGMGHEFPVELHGRFVEAFARNARKARRNGC